jgi:hypothetical protein
MTARWKIRRAQRVLYKGEWVAYPKPMWVAYLDYEAHGIYHRWENAVTHVHIYLDATRT